MVKILEAIVFPNQDLQSLRASGSLACLKYYFFPKNCNSSCIDNSCWYLCCIHPCPRDVSADRDIGYMVGMIYAIYTFDLRIPKFRVKFSSILREVYSSFITGIYKRLLVKLYTCNIKCNILRGCLLRFSIFNIPSGLEWEVLSQLSRGQSNNSQRSRGIK